ncbi:coiled-coil domain-containing protein 96 [Perognathus longimembris pacificus]|uniref:coiled-coil domain-containing protein 96 n=1 Tax=Perognathus longimembris pacificus TaxID=214514 RepID=UPI00201952BC|nr:coiled-coil domain-containing protein 96 [Perognathus longimembris pacificus]
MDDRSDHSEDDSGDEESLGTTRASDHQMREDAAEPEPEPAAEEGAAESPAASEARSEARLDGAGAEEPAEPAAAAEAERETDAYPRGSLPLTTIAEEAAPEAPKRGEEGRRSVAAAEDEEWSEEEKRQQEQQLRRELLDQYHILLMERNRYRRYNAFLQHRICESLRKKKGLEAAETPEKAAEPEAPEKEQAYLHYLAILEELKKQEADDLVWYQQEVGQLKQQCQDKLARVEKEWRRFQALKKQVVLQVMGSCRLRGGRQAALREVEQIQALEDRKEKEMSAVRLENVQLKQSLTHFQTRMRAQEDLSEGLLLIDFEQLKIENQTFNEKVEERNEELLKLRNKVTTNVQTITHVKEKLHYIDMENACKKTQLLEIESQVSLGRDILTRTKQARDSLRTDNIKLSQRSGLLGKKSLLRDLEAKVDQTEMLNRRLESLKRHHAGLTLSCKGVRHKIREAKAFLRS